MKALRTLRDHCGIASITLVGFFLRLYASRLDPFLHDWDERFHALVARNMMRHPFRPMLNSRPFPDYSPNAWCCNGVWLHKQPLFLWQAAISMKLFGVSEYTFRLPSVLLGTLAILLVYRIAWLLTANKTVALLAALLLCCCNYHLELISGRIGMDHNDVSFCFYVLASIWTYCEYLKRPRWYWAVLTGVFSGGAILNKWLTGLLVYLPWFLNATLEVVKSRRLAPFLPLAGSVAVCCAVFLPWQLYILHEFHDLAMYEYRLNSRHLTEVIEGNGGNRRFYLESFPLYFGRCVWMLGLGAFYLIGRKCAPVDRAVSRTLVVSLAAVFVLFSCIAKTKMPSYFFVVAPVFLVYMAVTLHHVARYSRPVFGVLLVLALFLILNPVDSYRYRQPSPYREARLYNTAVYKRLGALLPKGVTTVINVNDFEHPDVMFYNEGVSATHWWSSEAATRELQASKTPVAAFANRGGYVLPDYLARYPYLYVIPVRLR